MVCMASEQLLDRIHVDPNICFGKPCIRGTRIWVSLVLGFLADGWSVQQVLENYPHLEEARTRLPRLCSRDRERTLHRGFDHGSAVRLKLDENLGRRGVSSAAAGHESPQLPARG
jgi:uncharacterized protein (DUF433 family)